jgi:hypothetical protein
MKEFRFETVLNHYGWGTLQWHLYAVADKQIDDLYQCHDTSSMCGFTKVIVFFGNIKGLINVRN